MAPSSTKERLTTVMPLLDILAWYDSVGGGSRVGCYMAADVGDPE